MRAVLTLLLLLLSCIGSAGAFGHGIEKARSLVALCYHDIRDDVIGRSDQDTMAVSTRHLAEHFEWLRVNGYTPVTLDQVLESQSGGLLPEKPVLLTFDDGYASFYHEIFPLLRRFNYPAVMALVGRWLEAEPGSQVIYGNSALKDREYFLDASQIKEMAGSGLVEFASHTYDLHHGVIGNPQQNLQPAAVTRMYLNGEKRYETDQEYRRRIRSDLKRNDTLLEKLADRKPRTLVWPYGQWSIEAEEIARELGYEFFLTLDDFPHLADNTGRIGRSLIERNPAVEDIKYGLEHLNDVEPVRAAHIDLDYVYDENKEQQRKNLDRLLDRIKAMRINTVFLQAFSDFDGDGNANALYFPNPALPVRDDLFSRVSWQLEKRAGVTVYAWMPVAAFDVKSEYFAKHGVRRSGAQGIVPATVDYRRLSIFDSESVKLISSIYDSLGKYAHFDGVLYHDDAYFSDYEDLHPEAVKYYKSRGLDFSSLIEVHSDQSLMRRWTDLKIDAWHEFTDKMTKHLRYFRPTIRTARNIYAAVVLNTDSENWFAQSLDGALERYDYVAVMAMPYMENAPDPDKWLAKLHTAVRARLGNTDKVIFELQAKDWRNQVNIPTETLVKQFRYFFAQGSMNVAYYPDDFLANHPELEILIPGFSLETYPYRKQ
ncbi:MAG TPA: poly-beta-1,6-N-acetyl-D-glucosamine N-deacetylase PgaB [Arenicellales bacterium]|nr:poly-beta-1,6-N-acetyl-D-glucosamine N-deacetylase PgaB [Arenicellales bacterium]HJP10081.1 poly-beta-1,6-N-acetyl-D-glucosamine N-deacetylase PgaB [Arenicellales bacterium]